MTSAPVLIVDDDPATVHSVGNALRLSGYEVLTAENGSLALDITRERALGLILLDIGMPVMDGIEFLRHYAASDDAQAPVVVLSGLSDETRWQEAEAVLAALPKPFDVDELLEVVAKHVRLPEDGSSEQGEPEAGEDALAAKLVSAIATQRDPDSLAQLYDLFAPSGLAICLHIKHDRMWAEDMLQDAFLNIWRKAASFDPGRGNAKRWVLSVIYHKAIDGSRGGRGMDIPSWPYVAPEPHTAANHVWHDVEQTLQRELIVSALRSLPPEQRLVVEMAYFGGYTHAQMAGRLRVPLGTVKGRLRLAMDKLRLSLAGSLAAPSNN